MGALLGYANSFVEWVGQGLSDAAQAVEQICEADRAMRRKCENIGKHLGLIAETGTCTTLSLYSFNLISLPTACALGLMCAETFRLGHGYCEVAKAVRTTITPLFSKLSDTANGIKFPQELVHFYQASETTYLYKGLAHSTILLYETLCHLNRVLFGTASRT